MAGESQSERSAALARQEAMGAVLEEEAFASHLEALGVAPDNPFLEDLAAAFACARGDRAALAWFERRVIPALRPTIARISFGPELDDLLQGVRTRLLVPDADGRSRLLDYAGQGPLLSWAKAAAVRIALNSIRGKRPEVADEEGLEAAAALDVEGELLKAAPGAVRPRVQEGARGALGAGAALLKRHFVEGMALSQVGARYRVDKSTASRWLAKARGTLLEGTRANLDQELGLAPDEVRSLARLVRGRVSLGLSALLEGSG